MELDHEFTVPVPVEQAWPVLLDVERVAPCMPGASLDSIDGDEFSGRLRVRIGPVSMTYRGTAGFTHKDEQTHTTTIEGSGKEARGSGTASAAVTAQLHDEGGSTRVTVHTNLRVTGRAAQFGRAMIADVGSKLVDQFTDCLAGQLAGGRAEPASADAGAAAGTGAASRASAAPTETSSAASSPAPTAAAPEVLPMAVSPDGSGERSPDGQPARGAAATNSGPQPRSSPTARPAPGGEALDLFAIAGWPVLKRALPAAGTLLAILGVVVAVRRKRGR